MDKTKKTIIALDAMGGDNAPVASVKGAVDATLENPDILVKLVGAQSAIKAELSKYSYNKKQVEIINAKEEIGFNEHPVKAVLTKRDSSLVKALFLVKRGEADAFVSAGSTGAILVGAQTIIRTIPGIDRAAMGFLVPTQKGVSMIIDVGANVDCKPHLLVQFAQVASIYMENILGIESPKVGLINIGVEEEKGNALCIETLPLLKSCKGINFIGNVESREITAGAADILVCDAFVGNIILKFYEGVSQMFMSVIKDVMYSSKTAKMGGLMLKGPLKEAMKKFKSESYGGAPFLGLNNLVVKTHGNSKAVEFKNSILQCVQFIEADISGKISENLKLNEDIK